MMYANNKEGERIEASPKMVGVCPNCGQEVRARCGEIKIWHFSHISLQDCDSWSEGETEWHRGWKELFPKHEREIVMKPHRADIVHNRTVIEFQTKALDYASLEEREEFYGKMVWVVKSDKNKFTAQLKYKNGRDYYTFKWRWCSETWRYATKPIYVDVCDGTYLFKVWKIYDNNCGAGELIRIKDFII